MTFQYSSEGTISEDLLRPHNFKPTSGPGGNYPDPVGRNSCSLAQPGRGVRHCDRLYASCFMQAFNSGSSDRGHPKSPRITSLPEVYRLTRDDNVSSDLTTVLRAGTFGPAQQGIVTDNEPAWAWVTGTLERRPYRRAASLPTSVRGGVSTAACMAQRD